jgi:hypothetical protein
MWAMTANSRASDFRLCSPVSLRFRHIHRLRVRAQEIVWVKLAAAAEGARIASNRLWGRAKG